MKILLILCNFMLAVSLNAQAGVNVFNKLYPGDRNDVTGRRGYSFVAKEDFLIDALGRAATGGVLSAVHTVELYDVDSAGLLASVIVNSSSSIDAMGYAFEMINPSPVSIQAGNEYMLLVSETSGDGDLWFAGFMPNYRYDYIAIQGGEWSDTGSGMPSIRHEVDHEYGYGPAAFTMIDPQGESAAWSPSPADGTAELSPYVSLWNGMAFSWQGPLSPVNVTGEEVRYDVYFGTDPTCLSLVSADQAQTIWWPHFILNLGPVTYYWRVDSHDGADVLTGPVWSFSTGAGEAIAGDISGFLNSPDSKVDLHDLAVIAGDWAPDPDLIIEWPSAVNFQPLSSETPSGYAVDYGSAYGDRGNGCTYGWVGGNFNTRERNSASDQRYDTLNHMQLSGNAIWEVALPDGVYMVHLVMGDPSFTDTINSMDIEGTIVNDPDGQDNFDEYTVEVTVSDGNLTIQPAAGASNAKICYVDIIQ